MSKRTAPTFLLRGIDPKEILLEYLDGKYVGVDLPSRDENISDKIPKQVIQDIPTATTAADPIFVMRYKNYVKRIYTTGNYANGKYKMEFMRVKKDDGVKPKKKKKSPKSDPITILKCVHCLRPIEGDPLVIPTHENIVDDKIIYSGNHFASHLCCAYGHLVNEIKKDPTNSLYKDTMAYLKNIALFTTGSINIRCAPEAHLHEDHGGSMDDDEYYNGVVVFRKTPNMIFAVNKLQYEIDNE